MAVLSTSTRLAAARIPVIIVLTLLALSAQAQQEPGKRVSIGPLALQIHCSGREGPTVVVETGLGDFASDWALVQQRVERFARICTYDRAGYGSSDSGPTPRTFAQLNLELHELLHAAGEKPPYILVGHSYGGAVIRNYPVRYPDDIAGMVLVESVAEHQPLILGGKPTLLKEFASGKAIPEPRLGTNMQTDSLAKTSADQSQELPRVYAVLPQSLQELHRQFAGKPSLEAAENSQREWSSEYFAEWDRHPQRGLLKLKPFIVLTRAALGDDPNPNYSVEQVDGLRLRAQTEQLSLSSNSLQIVLPFGHNMHLEAPDAIASAIHSVVTAVRTRRPLVAIGVAESRR